MRRTTIGWILVTVQFALIAAVIVVPRRPDAGGAWLLVGGIVVLGGAVLTLWSMLALGSALRPNPVPSSRSGLRTGGPYRFVRHPIYSGIVLMALGYVVMTGSWWTAFMTLILAEFLHIKSSWEDSLLAEAYAAEWVEWARRTPGGFIPRKPR